MSYFCTLIISTAICASAMASETKLRKDLLEDVKNVSSYSYLKRAITSTTNQEVIPLRTSPRQAAGVDKKAILLYEDFDLVPDGRTERIDPLGDRYIDCIANHDEEPGRYINNEYTPQSGTWEGNLVMAGKGGTVILQAYNPQVGAYIATPLGDYSGNITVTVRARSSKAFWGSSKYEWGYTSTGGSALDLYVCINGHDSWTNAQTDIRAKLTSDQLVDSEGWQEITYTFHNEDAHADGHLKLHTKGAIEIDWIKVEDDNKFLAKPVIRGASDFTNDGFTIHWDPVRRAYNYYIDLWKAVYTSDRDINESCNFDESTLPEWINADSSSIVDNEGVNDSKALRILNDDPNSGISTTDFGAKLNSFSTQVKFKKGNPDNDIMILCDVFGNDGWTYYGYLGCDGEYVEADKFYTLILDGDDFDGKFSAIRLYASGANENNYICIDDVYVSGDRPYELERVGDDTDDGDDDPYVCFDHTDIGVTTSYTFSGLDPNGEYWYRVRSHHLKEFTYGDKYHAFGVAAPELLPATNVSSSSYTANWIDAPKAQKYIVTNYSGCKVKADDPQYSLMLETLGKCNNGETEINFMEAVGNESECFLDDYTDLKGWRGANVYVGQNMIGGIDNSRTHLTTPPIMCNPDRGTLLVYLEFIGYTGDYIRITCLKSGMTGDIPFDEEGMCSGWIEIPAVEGEQIKFVSSNGVSFAMCAFEAMQAVEAGDIIRRFDCSVEVPAGEQAYTFSNLSGEINSYSVVSSFTLKRENTLSTSDKFVTVDLGSGESKVTSKIDVIDSNLEEVSRYSISGVQVNKDYKGVVIVKMNDGSVSKKVVR